MPHDCLYVNVNVAPHTLLYEQTNQRTTWTFAKPVKYRPQMLSLSWPTGTSAGIVILWTVSCQDLFDLYGTPHSLYTVEKVAAEELVFKEYAGGGASYTSYLVV